ncbi:MAG: ParB/RepB/Spo0J family partition protein [Vicinamibacterales bacterium]
MTERRPALGRGLSALIPEVPAPVARDQTLEVDLDLLTPNPQQPRQQFDDAKLEELAQSIRTNGLIQPIVVRRRGTRFEIIAGERRWRAAQRAGVMRVPVVVHEVPDDKLLQVALIENIQREDLNPIDEALAYQHLVEALHLTQEDVATAVGKDRSSVANYLRLLKLPDDVRGEVGQGRLSMGHARALLGLEDPGMVRKAARDVLAKGLSVRETEALVRKLAAEVPTTSHAAPKVDVHVRAAEDQLRLSLGTRVRIVRRGKKHGRIEIDFVSEEELQRLYEYLTDRA